MKLFNFGIKITDYSISSASLIYRCFGIDSVQPASLNCCRKRFLSTWGKSDRHTDTRINAGEAAQALLAVCRDGGNEALAFPLNAECCAFP